MINYDSLRSVNEDAIDACIEDSNVSEDDVGGVVDVNSVVVESDWTMNNNIALVGNHNIAR